MSGGACGCGFAMQIASLHLSPRVSFYSFKVPSSKIPNVVLYRLLRAIVLHRFVSFLSGAIDCIRH